jgi:hypothetical protein
MDTISPADRRAIEERRGEVEFLSECVTTAIDPTVNLPYMRCSPGLPAYIAALERKVFALERKCNRLADAGLRASSIGMAFMNVYCREPSPFFNKKRDELGRIWLLCGELEGLKAEGE